VLSEYALRLDATFSQDWPKIALNEALVLGRDGHLIVHLHMSLEELVEECRHSVGLIGGQSPCFLLERSRIITLGHRPEGFASGFAGLNQPKAGNDPIVSFAGFSQEGGR